MLAVGSALNAVKVYLSKYYLLSKRHSLVQEQHKFIKNVNITYLLNHIMYLSTLSLIEEIVFIILYDMEV